jgi:hypothetical protein
MATSYPWEFVPRFRRKAFGWQSDTPIQRIKESLAEIKAVAKKEPAIAAEGAVLLLEKLAPAIEQVDSSSGRIGAAVDHAIEKLVHVIAQADVADAVSAKWLDRLWVAYEKDTMPSIEYLGDFWGELCATKALASTWADRLAPTLTALWEAGARGGNARYFRGTPLCFSALVAAGRIDELLALIKLSEYDSKWWEYRRWGARGLAAAGRHAEAIRYAEDTDGFNVPVAAIAAFCEGVLLETGFGDEAYARYGVTATYATTNAALFKAVVKKYPQIPRETILRDLIASQPGQEGKWFAAAKDAGLFELAITLANTSRSDPRTLTRAARDFADKQPEFALAAGMSALQGIAVGWGWEITSADVLDAYAAIMEAGLAADVSEAQIKADVRALAAASEMNGDFIERSLARQLAG